MQTSARWVAACGAAMFALLLACPAQAAFPGTNGKLAVAGVAPNDDIHTLNPDGTGITALAPHPARDSNPAWSPDGKRIAFDSSRAGSSEIFVMDADGSNLTMLTTSEYPDEDPYWSPDGTRIVFESTRAGNNRDLWVMNADGSNPTRLTTDPAQDRDPSWSPDGTKIAFSSDRESYVCDDPDNPWCYVRPTFRIFTVGVAGGSATRIVSSVTPDECSDGEDVYAPDWSPSGARVAYELIWQSWCDEGWYHVVHATGAVRPFLAELIEPSFPLGTAWSPDGREVAFVERLSNLQAASADGAVVRTIAQSPPSLRFPNWQPIPVNTYARPLSASPMKLSLVLAYEACDSPNRVHGPPLDFPSCSPPVQRSGTLTVGTSDSNGKDSHFTGFAALRSVLDNPATGEDEADVQLKLMLTDVRRRSDLADYAGEVQGRPVIRITDKDNTPSPGGPGAATVTDVAFPYTAPCQVTPDPNVGSTCEVRTSAEGLLPGAITRGKRAIWQLHAMHVMDGGPDGEVATADNSLFATQGIFIP